MPINLIVPENDEICPNESAERIFSEIGSTNKTITYVTNDTLHSNHEYFISITGNEFVAALIQTIENQDGS